MSITDARIGLMGTRWICSSKCRKLSHGHSFYREVPNDKSRYTLDHNDCARARLLEASHDHDHSHDEPDLSNAAKLVVMVDVLGAEGQRVPLENARIFVKEPHTDTVDHHHHVDGEPNATTNAAGSCRKS